MCHSYPSRVSLFNCNLQRVTPAAMTQVCDGDATGAAACPTRRVTRVPISLVHAELLVRPGLVEYIFMFEAIPKGAQSYRALDPATRRCPVRLSSVGT